MLVWFRGKEACWGFNFVFVLHGREELIQGETCGAKIAMTTVEEAIVLVLNPGVALSSGSVLSLCLSPHQRVKLNHTGFDWL